MNNKINVPRFKKTLGFETDNKRSVLMSKIRSKENKAEKALRKSLWNQGVRYRKNYKKLPGCPDILINKSKLIVFIDGEFWHGHNWDQKKLRIKANREFWIPKIERNMQRDQEINNLLSSLGFKVIRFWEHQVKKDLEGCTNIILNHINLKTL
ncbi:very short patch repair endonuclease [Mucilaginibacter rubeus]|uniref:Very short patch repair endonuclease n=1 Tax=Mucilaginibacter rubeus TaxID=2027860 RepID=A0AAE6JJW7_9SPHI|nr:MULTISPECIES: very short patch repair endonuclease [Mucilaginibacter]QEM06763.1 very short patch repair endonuclease [Mucilaginibacter rubeus]QEM19351.1 very short patch repair endonuclease [Mucilaginibacter gossypii]QTE44100.1 very short patch repair endonuclease [Mucilaginibacter rubeus]QTE50701.1 very short patch repair endonuclease [Mucilaginibacter rubeus]QTE55783.1 very short patch repair endonuclease [Mucilaginibacter rubeus]